MLSLVLPICLAFVMFSLGISLRPADFRVALSQPKTLLAGALAQMVLLPVVAYSLVCLFGLTNELAIGVMVLSCCPGGVTSNLFTRFARGDVALSISYTALASVLTAITLPLILGWVSKPLMADLDTSISTLPLSLKMLAMASLPVGIGVLCNQWNPSLCLVMRPWCDRLANVLLVLVIIGAVVSQWSLFVGNLQLLGPLLLLLNLVMLGLGLGVGTVLALPTAQVTTLAIESGFQNGTVGIVVGTLLSPLVLGDQLPGFSLPSAIYGVLMQFTVIPFVIWRRLSAPPLSLGDGSSDHIARAQQPMPVSAPLRGRR